MPSFDRKDIDENILSRIKKRKKNVKDDILDEIFHKAEIKKELKLEKTEKVTKKPFLKLGIILIIIAVLSLLAINYLPWIFIKFDTEYGIVQETFFIDFKNSEGYYHEKIDYIFESSCTNFSKNSNNFLGITKNDFTDVPKITTYAFIILAILGIIFTIFEIIERKYNLSIKLALLVHSTFAVAAFFISVFVIFILINFLGIYFLSYYNRPFIEASGIKNVILISPITINLILISLIIIIITTGVIQINFREFEKKVFLEKSHSALSTFKFGFKI